jgi:hypothetical protein
MVTESLAVMGEFIMGETNEVYMPTQQGLVAPNGNAKPKDGSKKRCTSPNVNRAKLQGSRGDSNL